jgi:RHS repeat-associated protein
MSADTVTNYAYAEAGNPQPHTLRNTTTVQPDGVHTSSFEYDAAGNTITRATPERGTQRLTWDALGRLTAVNPATTGTDTHAAYTYDANGQTLIQRNPQQGTATLYLPDQELTYSTASNTVAGTRYYTGPDGTTCIRRGSNANAYSYLITDHHGTATLSLDSAGRNPIWRDSTPFGGTQGSQPTTWPDTHGFLGQPTDGATGLTILGARHYDPTTARFISVDPVLDPNDPQQFSGYGYSRNDPVNNLDPNGLCAGREEGDICPGNTRGPWAARDDTARHNFFHGKSSTPASTYCGVRQDEPSCRPSRPRAAIILGANVVAAPNEEQLNDAIKQQMGRWCNGPSITERVVFGAGMDDA